MISAAARHFKTTAAKRNIFIVQTRFELCTFPWMPLTLPLATGTHQGCYSLYEKE